MPNLTMKLLAIFIIGAILKLLAHMIFGGGFLGTGIGILVDIAMLGYVYLVLREFRYFDTKKIMGFLGAITVISIFTDVGVIRGDFGSLLILGIIAWMLFGPGGFFSGGSRGRGGRGRGRY